MAVIALVAVVIFGPDKLPEFAKQAGRFLHRMKVFATGARDELRSELGPEFSDLELRDLDPRSIVRKHVMEAMEEAEAESSRPKRRGLRPLGDGEVPPYDVEAT
jgi:sec-independent protein translocase protein TatB